MRWPASASGFGLKLWHNHFLWWPIRLGRQWVVFEWVERKGTKHTASQRRWGRMTWWTWEYRECRWRDSKQSKVEVL